MDADNPLGIAATLVDSDDHELAVEICDTLDAEAVRQTRIAEKSERRAVGEDEAMRLYAPDSAVRYEKAGDVLVGGDREAAYPRRDRGVCFQSDLHEAAAVGRDEIKCETTAEERRPFRDTDRTTSHSELGRTEPSLMLAVAHRIARQLLESCLAKHVGRARRRRWIVQNRNEGTGSDAKHDEG
jgi:hypothetical protein